MRPYLRLYRVSLLRLLTGFFGASMIGIIAAVGGFLIVFHILGRGKTEEVAVGLYYYIFAGILAVGLVVVMCGVIAWIADKLLIHDPLALRMLVAAAGICMIVSIEIFTYWAFQYQLQNLTQQGYSLSSEEVYQLTDVYLENETGSRGMLGFLRLMALDTVTWLEWAGEIVLILIACWALAHLGEGATFDEGCNAWFGTNVVLGRAGWQQREQVKALFLQGDYKRAGELLTRETIDAPHMDVEVATSKEGCDVLITLREVNPSAATVKKERGLITTAEYETLRTYIDTGASQTVTE